MAVGSTRDLQTNWSRSGPARGRARARGHAHSRGYSRGRMAVAASVLGWGVVAGLAVVAVMRVVAWDALQPFAVLNTVTLFVYLPAWIVLVVAAVGRRFVLAAAALLVVVAQFTFLYPEWAAASPLPRWAAGAPSIRLLDANVYDQNPSMAGYAAQIRRYRPQLVTMEEATPPDVAQLRHSGALAALPHQVEIERYDPSAFFIASRYPLVDVNVIYDYIRPLVVELTVELPNGPQRLWVVHTIAPLPSSFTQWTGQLSTIGRLLRTRGPVGLLMVGDFNATWGNKGFRQILGTGMTDGAAARGDPLAFTWSQTLPLLPPLVRIDHVLTGPGLVVTSIRTGVGPGSDHRDEMATLAFRPTAPEGR